MYAFQWLQFGGLTEAFSQVVVGAGAVVLLLMLVALGSFAYKSYNGGVEWPDERPEEDGVSEGEDDDEWKFY
ncbi:hypothetical protein [Haloarcula onubensis]|uniref:Uncharacterized protein n=1 Tax=Haloarcula onubensis TaxID=2950539 RepID=A0ABU2FKD3_9EURY|nr:hypothetical protein [Halomicroarcula sp. S3CR25-11]MDS0280717.1 hypothetical protein [Halomicroarcula sp. S3CR25-11]